MTIIELNDWYILIKQVENDYHLSDSDKQELLRLNHRVMETANNIHNKNMLNDLNK